MAMAGARVPVLGGGEFMGPPTVPAHSQIQAVAPFRMTPRARGDTRGSGAAAQRPQPLYISFIVILYVSVCKDLRASGV